MPDVVIVGAGAPGKADARKVFSEPVHDRLLLAGEHVHPHYMATVHGAYDTGLDAAHKAATALGFLRWAKRPTLAAFLNSWTFRRRLPISAGSMLNP